jgi:hypothetical protein
MSLNWHLHLMKTGLGPLEPLDIATLLWDWGVIPMIHQVGDWVNLK